MRLDKSYVEKVQEVIDRKVEIWEEQFSRLKFDRWGRALIAPLTGIKESDCDNLKYASDTFTEAFNSYLEQKGYGIRTRYGNYRDDFVSNAISPFDYVENYYHFKKEDDKLVRVKASKVLASVQDIWVKDNPDYTNISKEIKSLRENGATYEGSGRLRELMYLKGSIEQGNLYVIYQSIMNQHNGQSSGVYLSVNPLDLLTSSGNYGNNPTNFSSCWSTDIYSEGDSVRVNSGSCYSSPEAILSLGNINNRGILYIPNDRTMEVPNTEFSLLGYKERTHCWFDISPNGLWLEKVYPSGYDKAFDKYTEALADKGIDRLKPDFDNDFDIRSFNYNDSDNLREFDYNRGGSVFLDSVAIENCTLYYLPKYRTEYNYDGNITGLLDNEDRFECMDCGDYCSEEYYVRDHGYICRDCRDNYSRCEECGDLTHDDDMCTVYNNNGIQLCICEGCRDYEYFYCESCGEYHHENSQHSSTDGYICSNCTENYSYCDYCGEYHRVDSYETEGGDYICEDCVENNNLDVCSACGVAFREVTEVDGDYYCDTCIPVECAV